MRVEYDPVRRVALRTAIGAGLAIAFIDPRIRALKAFSRTEPQQNESEVLLDLDDKGKLIFGPEISLPQRDELEGFVMIPGNTRFLTTTYDAGAEKYTTILANALDGTVYASSKIRGAVRAVSENGSLAVLSSGKLVSLSDASINELTDLGEERFVFTCAAFNRNILYLGTNTLDFPPPPPTPTPLQTSQPKQNSRGSIQSFDISDPYNPSNKGAFNLPDVSLEQLFVAPDGGLIIVDNLSGIYRVSDGAVDSTLVRGGIFSFAELERGLYAANVNQSSALKNYLIDVRRGVPRVIPFMTDEFRSSFARVGDNLLVQQPIGNRLQVLRGVNKGDITYNGRGYLNFPIVGGNGKNIAVVYNKADSKLQVVEFVPSLSMPVAQKP